MKYEFFQIYYDDSQLRHLIPDAKGHFNPTCTQYFESKVISDYEPLLCSKYVGTASWDLKKTWGIYNGKRSNFSIEQGLNLLEGGIDFLSLSYRRSHTTLVKQANMWHHPENFKPIHRRNNPTMFHDMFVYLCDNIGLDFEEPNTLVYEHTFFTTRALFIEYRNLLRKAITYIESNEKFNAELQQNAGYRHKKLPNKAAKEIGLTYYPFTPFLLERLLSVWVHWKVKEGVRFEYW